MNGTPCGVLAPSANPVEEQQQNNRAADGDDERREVKAETGNAAAVDQIDQEVTGECADDTDQDIADEAESFIVFRQHTGDPTGYAT